MGLRTAGGVTRSRHEQARRYRAFRYRTCRERFFSIAKGRSTKIALGGVGEIRIDRRS